MSTQMKLIIPLLDPNITKDDLSQEAGFVDAYLYDINRPSLVDNVFLMYKADTSDKKAVSREERFNDSPFMRSKTFIHVNDVCYIVYAFNILNKDIRSLKKGLPISTLKNYSRILSFWKGSEDDVNKAIIWTSEPYSVQIEQVPEADYYPSKADWYAIMEDIKNPEVS